METLLIALIGVGGSLLSGLLSELIREELIRRVKRELEAAASRKARIGWIRESEQMNRGPFAKRVSEQKARSVEEQERLVLEIEDSDVLVEKIRESVRQELQKDRKQTFILGFLQGLFFFGLGVGATLLISG
jgi:hypothetical protein